MEAVTFKLQMFEGPLDLLLHLIQKNKVNIYDIPITTITEQYMDYIDLMNEMDLEVTGEFLVVAAQLLYIKSKMLLPKEEKEEEEDPRTELIDRLVEYAKYKGVVEYLDDNQGHANYLFFKEAQALPQAQPQLNESVPLSKLLDAFAGVLERNRQKKTPIKLAAMETIVKRETVSVRSRIHYLYTIFKGKDRLKFEAIFEEIVTKAEAVSTFLAVLELARRGKMKVYDQDGGLFCKISGDENDITGIAGDD